MATKLKEVDAVTIGMGWTGSIISRELTKAGLTVVGLERGADRSPAEHFALPGIRDDLRYAQRQELFQDPAMETVSLRHTPKETALPLRRFSSFLPGDGVGGAGSHWNGQHWRFDPTDFVLNTHLAKRYGKAAVPEDMTNQDWGVTYDELEASYDKFEGSAASPARPATSRARRSRAAICSRAGAAASIPTSRSRPRWRASSLALRQRSWATTPSRCRPRT